MERIVIFEKKAMKKLLFLLLIIPPLCFSQIKFKKGVKVLEVTKSPDFKTPKSILFEFTGDTHLIYYYLELSEKLKKRAKKHDIKVGFNYKLNSKTPLKDDLETIPKKIESRDNYDSRCHVFYQYVENPKKWIKNGGDPTYRKMTHNMNFRLFNKNNDEILFTKFDIHSYFTIVTQSKKTSKKFFKLITE